MSHITKIELEVKDFETLARACTRLGMELVAGQKSFKWYGNEDGSCDHAIKIPQARYEIGVAKTGETYELKCDYYDQAIGKTIGSNGGLLKQAYAVERTKTEARRKGYTVIEKKAESGIRLHVQIT